MSETVQPTSTAMPGQRVDRPRRVAVLGLGYVGLPLAVRAAEVGHQVVGFDPDQAKVAALRAGDSYVEDIGASRLAAVVEPADGTGSLRASSDAADLAGFEVAVIAVPTPLAAGSPDLSFVEGAARLLGPHLRPGATVVLESTTYPGTTEHLVADALRDISGLAAGEDYHLGFSPERIDPGNRTWHLETTPKIVSGTTPASLQVVQEFYDGLVERTVPVSSPRVAELAKLLENTFRHVNIALVNELAVLAHELGIDVWEAIDAAATKPFGFMKFTPGPGVGGHCLPIDPEYLSWTVRRELDKSFRFVELAVDINNHMPDHVVSRVAELLNRHRKCMNGSRVLVLGAAYKAGTADVRESPSHRIIDLLEAQGVEVHVADPYVGSWSRTPLVDLESVIAVAPEFDLTLVVTDHDEFDFDKIADRSQLVLDCRNRTTPAPHVHHL